MKWDAIIEVEFTKGELLDSHCIELEYCADYYRKYADNNMELEELVAISDIEIKDGKDYKMLFKITETSERQEYDPYDWNQEVFTELISCEVIRSDS